MDDTRRENFVEDVVDDDYNPYDNIGKPEDWAKLNADVISWEDLSRSATVFPELTQIAKKQIVAILGYLPAEAVTIAYEPYLRTILNQFKNKEITFEEYWELAGEHMKLIRNKDMRFHLVNDYDDEMYQNYRDYYVPYIVMARERLVDILGYEPELRHSISAEMWLSKEISKDTAKLATDNLTPIDFWAVGLTRYREVLLAKGKRAADDWPIARFDVGLVDEYKRGPACE